MQHSQDFLIRRAQSWALESGLRMQIGQLPGVRDIDIAMGERRVSVNGDVAPEQVIDAARAAGCELMRFDADAMGAGWQDVDVKRPPGPLAPAWIAGLLGVALAVGERTGWLPAQADVAGRPVWLSIAVVVFVLGVGVVRGLGPRGDRYPGAAVISAAGVFVLGAAVAWLAMVAECLLGVGCRAPLATLDASLVALAAASLVLAVGRRSWWRLQRSIVSRTPPCPERVIALRRGSRQTLELSELRPGELLLAESGSVIAADGVVTRGSAEVDESGIMDRVGVTRKSAGDEVLAGSTVVSGELVSCVSRVGGDTVLAQIMTAAGCRGQRPRAALRPALVQLVLAAGAAAAVLAAWLLLGGWVYELTARQVALAALFLLAPAGFAFAQGRLVAGAAARLAAHGVLVRSGESLERAARMGTVVMDQGMSLTEGAPQVMAVEPAEGARVRDIFALAAGAEAGSSHPLAEAIVSAAVERDLPLLEARQFQEWPQEGVSAVVNGHHVLVGNARLLARFGLHSQMGERAGEMADDGRIVVHVMVDDADAGLLAVDDAPAPDAAETLTGLRALRLNTAVVTGANQRSANSFGRTLGVTSVHAQLSPQGKADMVHSLRKRQGPVACVTRPTGKTLLAASDLSVVLRPRGEGIGPDGDVVLLNGLYGVVILLRTARDLRGLRRRVRSLTWGYLAAVLPLASGLTYPALGWMLPAVFAPILAALVVMALEAVSTQVDSDTL